MYVPRYLCVNRTVDIVTSVNYIVFTYSVKSTLFFLDKNQICFSCRSMTKIIVFCRMFNVVNIEIYYVVEISTSPVAKYFKSSHVLL